MVGNIRKGLGGGPLVFQQKGKKWQPCHERLVRVCPENRFLCSDLDVVFCIDITSSMGAALGNIKTQIQQIVQWVQTTVVSPGGVVRYGVITFSDSVFVDLVMSPNNRTDFENVIAGLTLISGGGVPENSNGALKKAVQNGAGVWRASSTVAKRIVLITDAPPGGSPPADSFTPGVDDTDLNNWAATGRGSDILSSFIMVPDGWVPQSQIRSVYQTAAGFGGGVFVESSSATVSPAILQILEGTCYSDKGVFNEYGKTNHAHCCRTAVCTLCLVHKCYGNVATGKATWNEAEGAYTGSIRNTEFKAYPDIRETCMLYVVVGGQLVATFPYCPQKDSYGNTDSYALVQKCRDPSGSFFWTHNAGSYDECAGELSFFTLKPVRLRMKKQGYCAEYYCGQCQCSPRELCAKVIVRKTNGIREFKEVLGSFDDGECEIGVEKKNWRGSVPFDDPSFSIEAGIAAAFDLSLVAGSYGECRIAGTIKIGYDTQSINIPVSGCVSVSVLVPAFSIGYETFEISFYSKGCDECESGVIVPCCKDPLPRTMYLDMFTTTPSPGPNPDDCGCVDGSYRMDYTVGSGLIGGFYAHWTTGELKWLCDNDAYDTMVIEHTCLTTVWQLWVFLLKEGEVVFSQTYTASDPENTCDPFEQNYGEHAVFEGGCKPGLVPDRQTLIVSE